MARDGRAAPGDQLQAAIAACHAEAPSRADTGWRQIVVLYDLLLRLSPSPAVRLNRAVALRWVAGPEAALAELDALADALDGYHPFHAARAELLEELGHGERAQVAELCALLERRPGLALSPGGGA